MQLLNSKILFDDKNTRYCNKKAQDTQYLVLFVCCSYFVQQRWLGSTKKLSFTALIFLDISVCKFYIFFARNNGYQVSEYATAFAFLIQFIQNTLDIIVLGISQFAFLFRLHLSKSVTLLFVDFAFLSLTRTFEIKYLVFFNI